MRRYLAILAIAFLATLGAAAGFNRLIDPYGYWTGPDLAFNHYKPESGRHGQLVKQAQYARVAPRTLLAGNSRVSVGFDPLSAAWPRPMQPVYNLGLPGVAVRDSVEAAMAAAETHRPDTIVFGLDFLDFRMPEAWWTRDEGPPEPRAYQPSLAERANLLFSTAALSDSVATLMEQRARFPATTTPQGWDGPGSYRTIIATEGQRALFDQKDAEYAARFAKDERHVRWDLPGGNYAWAAIVRLADYCAEHRIRLVLFTYPYHANMLAAFGKADMLDDMAEWRRDMAAFGTERQLAVYDFTGVNPISSEPIPAPGDRTTEMRWYWESGHFKAALGDRMIAAMTHGDGLLTSAAEPARTAALLAGIHGLADARAVAGR
jgi:hypothetical protein